jgi:hypothetical protein
MVPEVLLDSSKPTEMFTKDPTYYADTKAKKKRRLFGKTAQVLDTQEFNTDVRILVML